ncbi:ABC transporter permease [Limnohabitans parvus]|jgi:ABC-2 type transport system permease protein|uniref:ABC transporter n=1 Tax=Limnohabitans parvus II-B4 TaxID=1293052 RepID=A0A315EDX4_9BURK|nr:ABC transporter permease [Limnohabitans parvus]PUE55078.1 ABC transporter [Limnohabitans parvus II-B4]
MHHFFDSARREARRLGQSPWDLAMVTWVPLLAVVLVVWMFSSAIPRNLPVGVVDEDHSGLSRQLVRMLDASPGIQVVDEFDSESSAQNALRSVRVYAMVNIPRDFERDIKRGVKSEVTLRHNAQFATHSSLLQRDVRTVVGTLAAGIEVSARTKRGESPQQAKTSFNPIQTQSIALFNGSGNYEKYLTAAVIPAILHILAMTAGAWAVGRELRDKTLGQWLGHEGGRSVAVALLGKLAIPWMTLTGIGTGALWFITAGRGWDIPGHLAWICLALALLMALSLAAGAAVAALTKSLRTALSVTGLLTAPAFAFSGMSFPLSAMPDSARLWATSMPFTHYIRLQTEQLLMGLPARASAATPVAFLLATLGLLALAAWGLVQARNKPSTWGAR